MMETLFFFIHSALLLSFGIDMSFSFAGLHYNKSNIISLMIFYVFCGLLQFKTYSVFDENVVRVVYPLITHLPVLLLLKFKYRKSWVVSLSCVTSAYLCCQIANWIGLMSLSFDFGNTVYYLVCILSLIGSSVIVHLYFVPFLSEILMKEDHNAILLTLIPCIYYLFDYTAGSVINEWQPQIQTIVEFLAFLICIAYLIFGVLYYREYESKLLAEKKEQIIQISSDQLKKEIDLMETNSQRIRLIRHDMRLLLNQLAVMIQNDEKQSALELISSLLSEVDSTSIIRYCSDETINSVLSVYAVKCSDLSIQFETDIQLTEFHLDPLLFSSILSNALDNALNAQKELSEEKRCIKLMLKNSGDKILLSLRNPYLNQPEFIDGIPVSSEKGHGYGTQSIRYLTERLHGNYQFSCKDGWFILRIVF